MKIAIEGCCHGELDSIYEALKVYENRNSIKVDLLIICGDFQAVRNRTDMKAMAVPQKYREMKTFYKYYSGECTAPVLTIFVGGNHEASNYLQELPYGGWVAKNIYYMGYANVVQFGGIRIAGISGIYKKYNFNFGHHEKPPYNDSDIKSVYHMRNLEVFRLKHIRQPIDIVISHDWPRGIFKYGDANALLRYKKHFKAEMDAGTLGNPATEELLFTLKPTYWFAAHMHCRFQAIVQHEIMDNNTKFTKFLALDKCLPNRKFLEIIDIDSKNTDQDLKLHLDPEWLSILKLTNHFFSLSKSHIYFPEISESSPYYATGESLQSILEDFMGNFVIPDNFERTASTHSNAIYDTQMLPLLNPQTQLICSMLDIIDPFQTILGHFNNISTPKHNMAKFQPSQNNSLILNSSITSKNFNENISNIFSPKNFNDSLVDESFNNSDFVNSTINFSLNSTINRTLGSSINLSSTCDLSLNPDEISLANSENEQNAIEEKSFDGYNQNNCNSFKDDLFKSMRQKLSEDLRLSMLTSSPVGVISDSKVFHAENLEDKWIAEARNKSKIDKLDLEDPKTEKNFELLEQEKEFNNEALDDEELAFLGPDAKKLSLSPITSHSLQDKYNKIGNNSPLEIPLLNKDKQLNTTPFPKEKINCDLSINNSHSKGLKRRNIDIYLDKEFE